jgi:hypothetical protein
MSWFDSLPAAETAVPCGTGTHTVRWEGGLLTLPAHPDAEAELVLGALGGERPACITLAQTWAGHADDLAVLTAGPRSSADRVSVDWAEIAELRAKVPFGRAQMTSMLRMSATVTPFIRHSGPQAGTQAPLPAGHPGPASRLGATGMEEVLRRQLRQVELLELLALGADFQFRLAGTVIAAWAGPDRAAERARRRPELSGVLTGRFALAAREWAGVDPDAVTVTPHEGDGWGNLEISGAGRSRRLHAALPLRWLAEVWAGGLSVVDGHLVVAVEQPGYPLARVLALAAPDAEPAAVEVRATGSPAGGLMTWTL